MKLTYAELDSRKLKEAISRKEDVVISVTSQHADAFEVLVDLVADIKAWSETKPSVVEKWISLQKAFILAVRSLFKHGRLVELLPALLSSDVETQRTHFADGSIELLIRQKQ